MREFERMSCESEEFTATKILAINIPKEADHRPIKQMLVEGLKSNKWGYENLV